jgi:hypothetical protein
MVENYMLLGWKIIIDPSLSICGVLHGIELIL